MTVDDLAGALALLEIERARYADFFENAADAYVTTDGRGVIREANAAAASLLGISPQALREKLLIAFVARADTRRFRERLAASRRDAGRQTFSLRLRPRGRLPFVVSLSVRTVRDRSTELRWTIRPAGERTSDGERGLLAGIVREIRLGLAQGEARMIALADDIEQIALSADEVPRSPVAPARLLERASERAAALLPRAAPSVAIGSLEDDGVDLHVAPDRATWALARLFCILRDTTVRGRRASSSSYVLELHASARPDCSAHRLGAAAVQAALGAEGATLSTSMAGNDGDGLVCEVALPALAAGDRE